METTILITSAILFISTLIMTIFSERSSRKLKREADARLDEIRKNGRKIQELKNNMELRKWCVKHSMIDPYTQCTQAQELYDWITSEKAYPVQNRQVDSTKSERCDERTTKKLFHEGLLAH